MMCLSSVMSENQRDAYLKRFKKVKVAGQECLVGYKVFSLKVNKKSPFWIEYPCRRKSMKVKLGWNHPHPKGTKKLCLEHTRELYPNGFHVFVRKRDVDKIVSTSWNLYLSIPVYFRKEDVLCVGKQKVGYSNDSFREYYNSFVVRKYFLRKDDANREINGYL